MGTSRRRGIKPEGGGAVDCDAGWELVELSGEGEGDAGGEVLRMGWEQSSREAGARASLLCSHLLMQKSREAQPFHGEKREGKKAGKTNKRKETCPWAWEEPL